MNHSINLGWVRYTALARSDGMRKQRHFQHSRAHPFNRPLALWADS